VRWKRTAQVAPERHPSVSTRPSATARRARARPAAARPAAAHDVGIAASITIVMVEHRISGALSLRELAR
jgi:hypothetical protein